MYILKFSCQRNHFSCIRKNSFRNSRHSSFILNTYQKHSKIVIDLFNLSTNLCSEHKIIKFSSSYRYKKKETQLYCHSFLPTSLFESMLFYSNHLCYWRFFIPELKLKKIVFFNTIQELISNI